MTVFDRAHFDRMTSGDRALQDEVIGLFRQQVGAWAADCEGADWRTAVHTMKGSARGIGLLALAAACEAAEAAPEAGCAAALAAVRVALGEAVSVLEQFAAAAA